MNADRRQQFTVRIPIKNKQGQVVDFKEVIRYEGLLSEVHKEGVSVISTDLVQAPTEANGQTAIVKAEITTTKGRFTGLGDANPDNVNAMVVRHLLRVAETRAKARAMRDAVNIGMVSLEELGGEAEDEVPAVASTAQAPNGSNGHTAQPTALKASDPAPTSMSGAAKARHLQQVPTGNGSASPAPDATSMSHAEGDDTGHGSRVEHTPPTSINPMTEAQRKLIFRLAFKAGHQGEGARDFLLATLGVAAFKDVSKQAASALIDKLQDPFESSWLKREREMPGSNGNSGSNGAGVHHA